MPNKIFTTETAKDFYKDVKAMRVYQTKYFATKDTSLLTSAKNMEIHCDKMIKEIDLIEKD